MIPPRMGALGRLHPHLRPRLAVQEYVSQAIPMHQRLKNTEDRLRASKSLTTTVTCSASEGLAICNLILRKSAKGWAIRQFTCPRTEFLLTMSSMNGQWLGRYFGTTSGAMIVNIDERRNFYRGAAYLIEDDRKLPDSLVGFQTVNKEITV